jgi:RHS repeat-associated protein
MRSTGHELFFYKAGKPASVLGDQPATAYLRVDTTLLSDLTGGSAASLLAVESSGSVLQDCQLDNAQGFSYTPYGQRSAGDSRVTRMGFNGEYLMPSLSMYLLGNGYRAFNPVLMRFHSPDSFSPFRVINAYAYCGGDPVNNLDPDGHIERKHLAKLNANIKIIKNAQSKFIVAAESVSYLPDNMLLPDAEQVVRNALNKIYKLYEEASPALAWLTRKAHRFNSKYRDKFGVMNKVSSRFKNLYTHSLSTVNLNALQKHAKWTNNSANRELNGELKQLEADGSRLRLGGSEAGPNRLIEIDAEKNRLRKD